MRLGLVMVPTDPWPVAVARARRIEELGFDHLWTYDHLSWRRFRDRPWLGTIPWLTGIAAATSRIRLGTMVTSPNFRHPVVLAKDVMTIDQISQGRLVLGAGAGGVGFDATVMGDDVLAPRARADRFEDFVAMLDGLLSEQHFTGGNDHYRAVEARNVPGCVQQPRVPFAIAAAGPRTMGTAARYGQSWVTFGDPHEESASMADLTATVRGQRAMLEQACAETGRETIDSVFLSGNAVGRPLASMAAFEDFVGWADQEGFTDVVLHDPRPDDQEWNDDPGIIEEIAARYLSAADH